MRKHPRIFIPIGLVIALAFSLLMFVLKTTPDSVGPAGIAFFFALVYGVLAVFVTSSLMLSDVIRGGSPKVAPHLGVALAASLPVVMVLALNTIRSISLFDLGLAVFFGLLLMFYIKKR